MNVLHHDGNDVIVLHYQDVDGWLSRSPSTSPHQPLERIYERNEDSLLVSIKGSVSI